jgi:UDP-glucose 4-epimerase
MESKIREPSGTKMKHDKRICLVMGGAGFIGRHTTEALLRSGYQVRVFDREGSSLKNICHLLPRAELFLGDFNDQAYLAKALKGVTEVCHLIGTTVAQTSNENPVYDLESNVIPTLRFLELAVRQGVQRVIFSSSGGTVYGLPNTVPIPESHPTEPICAYGISKLAIEKYLSLHARLFGLHYVILRLSNPFGEGLHRLGLQGVINVLLRRIFEGRPLEIWGDGNVVRDYVYAGDAAESFVSAIETETIDEIYNIGSGRGRSLNDLLASFRDALGLRPEVIYRPSRPFDVPTNVLDIRKARRLLPWEPSTSFEQGLRRTWDWIRKG